MVSVPPPAAGERMRHDEGIPGAETGWELAVRAYAALDRILLREDDYLHNRGAVQLGDIGHLA
jgi:hypothetical protein